MAEPTEVEEIHQFGKIAFWTFLAVGVLSAALGIIVLVQPHISLKTLAIITGIFLVISGLADVVRAIAGAKGERGLVAALGILSVIVGVLLIRDPINVISAIAIIVGLWLIAVGLVRFVQSFSQPTHRWSSIAISVVEVVAGVAIVVSPSIGLTTLALLIGLSFLLRGIVLIIAAFGVRSLTKDVVAV